MEQARLDISLVHRADVFLSSTVHIPVNNILVGGA
jgi:hypothetical protein